MHYPILIVKERYRKSERMRKVLLGAWCELRFAACDARRAGDVHGARRIAAEARELIAVFGRRVPR